MALRNISNNLLDKFTGFPSKDAFLSKHVVPAKDDDKFNDNKCAQCWGGYTEEHPGVKVLPCGHVFGRDCLHEMVKSSGGDLCALCRVKLFRRELTREVIVLTLLSVLAQAIMIYWETAKRAITGLHRTVRTLHPWLKLPLQLILDGPKFWAEAFVCQYTDICSRNPELIIRQAFASTSLMTNLLYVGLAWAPLLVLVYLIFGITCFKIFLVFVDLAFALSNYHVSWTFGLIGKFDHPADRKTVAYTVAVALLLKELLIVWMLWPATAVPMLRCAWTLLGAIAWR